MTAIAEAFKKANESNLNKYEWRTSKDENGVYKTYKLMECSFEQLHSFYKHCQSMLENEESTHLGRSVIMNMITSQISKSYAELVVRMMVGVGKSYSTRLELYQALKHFIELNPNVFVDAESKKNFSIVNAISGLDSKFTSANLEDVMNACLSSLGKIQLTKISLNFILSLGINLNKESQEVVESWIRTNINLPKDTKLKFKTTGITKEELYDIIKMKSDSTNFGKFVFAKDYNDLSSSQLNLLVTKLLPALYNKCGYQKFLWAKKMKEIQDVGLAKGWNVANEI